MNNIEVTTRVVVDGMEAMVEYIDDGVALVVFKDGEERWVAFEDIETILQ